LNRSFFLLSFLVAVSFTLGVLKLAVNQGGMEFNVMSHGSAISVHQLAITLGGICMLPFEPVSSEYKVRVISNRLN
jgi:hypothetical protein